MAVKKAKKARPMAKKSGAAKKAVKVKLVAKKSSVSKQAKKAKPIAKKGGVAKKAVKVKLVVKKSTVSKKAKKAKPIVKKGGAAKKAVKVKLAEKNNVVKKAKKAKQTIKQGGMSSKVRPITIDEAGLVYAQDQNVYVGIDFGTSYSKVAFSIEQGFCHKIDFGRQDSYYKPSVIYYNNNSGQLSYKKSAGFKKHTFFKTAPLSNELAEHFIDQEHGKLFSVFFVACLINETKEHIKAFFKRENIDKNPKLCIKMGAPFKEFTGDRKSADKCAGEYEKILRKAYVLSEEISESDTINISDIRNICEDKSQDLMVISELYAEFVEYLEKAEEGFHCIMDIGGGTVDFGVFETRSLKKIDGRKETKHRPIAERVIPFGCEIFNKRTEKDIIDCPVKEGCMDEEGKKCGSEKKARSDFFRMCFKNMIWEHKRLLVEYGKKYKWKLVVKTSGGGVEYGDLQKKHIEEGLSWLKRYIPGIDVKMYSIGGEHRLLVAKGLANRDIVNIRKKDMHFFKEGPLISKDARDELRWFGGYNDY